MSDYSVELYRVNGRIPINVDTESIAIEHDTPLYCTMSISYMIFDNNYY